MTLVAGKLFGETLSRIRRLELVITRDVIETSVTGQQRAKEEVSSPCTYSDSDLSSEVQVHPPTDCSRSPSLRLPLPSSSLVNELRYSGDRQP
jgi:hypothetical protein